MNIEVNLIEKLELAVETISSGLSEIDSLKEHLPEIKGKKVIDITARLSAQLLALEKIVEPLKSAIKAESLTNNEPIIKGDMYQAVIAEIPMIVLNTEKIKDFLGPELYKYQKERVDVRVVFKVKA